MNCSYASHSALSTTMKKYVAIIWIDLRRNRCIGISMDPITNRICRTKKGISNHKDFISLYWFCLSHGTANFLWKGHYLKGIHVLSPFLRNEATIFLDFFFDLRSPWKHWLDEDSVFLSINKVQKVFHHLQECSKKWEATDMKKGYWQMIDRSRWTQLKGRQPGIKSWCCPAPTKKKKKKR